MSICLRRREFIAGLGGAAAAWPLAAWAQQGGRMRRIGVLGPGDENDPLAKPLISAFAQALAGLGWTDGRNMQIDFRGPAVTSIGCERSRRSWSVCNPTSS
jgi:putative ABC transport system substrate-binding protein